MNPLWTLAPAGLLLGAAAMWVFRKTADTAALGAAARRIQAHLIEFWLFADEPALVGKFWRDLIAANARLARLLLFPLALVSGPAVPLFFLMDSLYGHSPLEVGRPAVVTARFAGEAPSSVWLGVPEGIRVESPPVRAAGARELSWRIRPERAASGSLRITASGSTAEKSIRAGGGFAWLSRKRVRCWLELIRYPTERPLAAGPALWIEVDYPPASPGIAGCEAHWSVWFAVSMLAGALTARR